MTRLIPEAGDIFIDDRKRERLPDSSWLYMLVKQVPARKPVNIFDPVNRSVEIVPGWYMIRMQGKMAGRPIVMRLDMMKRLRYAGHCTDRRLDIPPIYIHRAKGADSPSAGPSSP